MIDKENSKILNKKLKLEEDIVSNLDDKITHNKVIRHLNKLLSDIRDSNQEQELSMMQTENTYGKNIHEIEKLNSRLDNEKTDLQEIEKENIKRDKEIKQMEAEIEKCDNLLEQKQRKIITLNKKIEEVALIALLTFFTLYLKITKKWQILKKLSLSDTINCW